MKKRILLLVVAFASGGRGDEFTREDEARWEKEYQAVVKKGRQLWISAALGASCAQGRGEAGWGERSSTLLEVDARSAGREMSEVAGRR